jgi:hypothetical protein
VSYTGRWRLDRREAITGAVRAAELPTTSEQAEAMAALKAALREAAKGYPGPAAAEDELINTATRAFQIRRTRKEQRDK